MDYATPMYVCLHTLGWIASVCVAPWKSCKHQDSPQAFNSRCCNRSCGVGRGRALAAALRSGFCHWHGARVTQVVDNRSHASRDVPPTASPPQAEEQSRVRLGPTSQPCWLIALDGGSIEHIFWACPEAQSLWHVVRTSWTTVGGWASSHPSVAFQTAVFRLQLPAFPASLWRLHELAAVRLYETDTITVLHDAAQAAWAQQILCTLGTIWRWWHNVDGGVQHWSTATAYLYLRTSLRSATLRLVDRLPSGSDARDPRRQLLNALADCFSAVSPNAAVESPLGAARYLLFAASSADCPSRPAGAGAVILSTDRDGVSAAVIWSAQNHLAPPDGTVCRASYVGLINGLQAALARGWTVEVICDSALLTHQLRQYHPPKDPVLRHLYGVARILADSVGVRFWHHHVRAQNMMSAVVASRALSTHVDAMCHHTSSTDVPDFLNEHLASDLDAWRAFSAQVD